MLPAELLDGPIIAASIIILSGVLYIGFMLWAGQKDREWEEKKRQHTKRTE